MWSPRTARATFCWGYGDDNPLYCDANYAKDTRWGGLITAPGLPTPWERMTSPPCPRELKQKLKGDPLTGLGAYQAEMTFEWWKPLREGDRCYLRKALVGTRLAEGRVGGKSIHEVRGIFQRNQDGEPVAARRGLFIANERARTRVTKRPRRKRSRCRSLSPIPMRNCLKSMPATKQRTTFAEGQPPLLGRCGSG